MRTLVDLPSEDVRALDELGRRRKHSRAHLIRAAVDDYLQRHQPSDLAAAFGLWGSNQEDGLDYQRRIRGEW